MPASFASALPQLARLRKFIIAADETATRECIENCDGGRTTGCRKFIFTFERVEQRSASFCRRAESLRRIFGEKPDDDRFQCRR
jgi:hypothetical protein